MLKSLVHLRLNFGQDERWASSFLLSTLSYLGWLALLLKMSFSMFLCLLLLWQKSGMWACIWVLNSISLINVSFFFLMPRPCCFDYYSLKLLYGVTLS
jgi:hypothetical protein